MKTDIIKIESLSQRKLNEAFMRHIPIPFPTETVFGLGAAYDDEKAIKEVFHLKGRPLSNPLIVHVSNVEMIHLVSNSVSEDAKKLIEVFFPGPLTLVLKKHPRVPDLVTAGYDTVAVRMPKHAVACKLIDMVGKPLVAPSANLSGKPSATHPQHVYDDFNGKIPFIIDGEASMIGIESTIVDMTQKPYTILRPGHITVEALKDVLGDVFGGDSQTIAPGMMHPHYEPTHPLYILEGSDEAIIKFMKKKDRAVFIGHERFQTNMDFMISLGHNHELMIKSLYHVLRQTNDLDVDEIYTHKMDHQAYMNRLFKAAKGRIISL